MLLDLISKLLNGSTPPDVDADDYKLIAEDLVRLGDDAVRYVCFGDDDRVLSALPSNDWQTRHAIASVYAAKNTPRPDFFMGMKRWNPALMRRYGELLFRANEYKTDPLPGTGQSPGWFRVLLFELGRARRAMRDKKATPPEPNGWLTLARLQELLALDGSDAMPIFDVALHHGSRPRLLVADPVNLWDLPGLTDLFQHSPLPAVNALRGLPPDSRASAIRIMAVNKMISGPYFDFLFDSLTDASKGVREAASAMLHGVDRDVLAAKAEHVLANGNAAERLETARIVGSALGESGRTMLAKHLPKESSKKVIAEIEAILRNSAVPEIQAADDASAYRAADGTMVAIPPLPPLPADTPVPDTVRSALRAFEKAWNEEAEAIEREPAPTSMTTAYMLRKRRLPPGSVDRLCDLLGSGSAIRDAEQRKGAWWGALYTIPYHKEKEYEVLTGLWSDPGVTLWHLVRGLMPADLKDQGITRALLDGRYAGSHAIHQRLGQDCDLRVVSRIAETMGVPEPWLFRPLLGTFPFDLFPRAALWPWLTEHFAIVDEALGMAAPSGDRPVSETAALSILAVMPKLPARYLGAVLDRAVGDRKAMREPARALLANMPAADQFIVPLLENPKQDVRVQVCEWLADRNATSAVTALRKALGKEKQEAVRAAILTALTRLGDDISGFVSPEALLKEATAGLSKTKPKGLDWFPFASLPSLRWQDGKAVDPTIVRFWIILANKLKQAGGDPLFELYLDRIEPDSARTLGAFVLQAFIAHDTAHPTEEEAAAHAKANAQAYFQSQVRYDKDLTYEQAYEWLRVGKLGEYPFNAYENKGILGLASRARAVDAVALVRTYLRERYARTAQCKALLECLAANSAPAAIQFVLSIANRWRSNNVKEHAAQLVQAIADQRGWSAEQLADRTIPTAGMDETGTLELPIGDRLYAARLDAEGRLELFNPEGRAVKALPSSDDEAEAEAIAEAKKTLSAARKELKQAQEFQQRRLYEALCVERRWDPQEWDTYLLRHPVVGRLVQRLIWAGLDDKGAIVATFRPLADLTLTDATDKPVNLQGFAAVRLAHRCLLSAGAAEAWQRHLGDYKITPLLEQLKRPFLALPEGQQAETEITDRLGWLVKTFELRSVATKLGYVRGQPGDGGVFTEYVKSFDALGIAAFIEFTGSNLPEENRTAALKSLFYAKVKGANARYSQSLPLSKVPAVLLSETWNDLHAMAEAGDGFAEDWEERSEW